MSELLTYSLILGANVTFAGSTVVFTHFSQKNSVVWVNLVKSLITWICFLLSISLFFGWTKISYSPLTLLLISGFIGLNISDILLLKAFTIIGPGRTLVLFSFQPIILGMAGYFLFGQSISSGKLISIIFMIACLLVFLQERRNDTGKWQFNGFIEAFLGVLLDATGIILTRLAFEQMPTLTPFEGCFYRFSGALLGFIILGFVLKPNGVIEKFKSLNPKEKSTMIAACLIGTYLSSVMYLSALKYAHLASISALAITGPIFASVGECIVTKKKPSRYLLIAFVLFIIGILILSFGN